MYVDNWCRNGGPLGFVWTDEIVFELTDYFNNTTVKYPVKETHLGETIVLLHRRRPKLGYSAKWRLFEKVFKVPAVA